MALHLVPEHFNKIICIKTFQKSNRIGWLPEFSNSFLGRYTGFFPKKYTRNIKSIDEKKCKMFKFMKLE